MSEKTKVVVFIQGGMVIDVISDQPVEVLTVDYDNNDVDLRDAGIDDSASIDAFDTVVDPIGVGNLFRFLGESHE